MLVNCFQPQWINTEIIKQEIIDYYKNYNIYLDTSKIKIKIKYGQIIYNGNIKIPENSEIKEIKYLNIIIGNLTCNNNVKYVESLGRLKKVEGDIDLFNVKTLKNLGELEEVGCSLYLTGTSIKSLGKLKRVGGSLILKDVKTLKDLGELEEVGYSLDLTGTSIESLGKLKRVGGYIDLEGVQTLKDLGELKEVERKIYAKGCSFDDWGKFEDKVVR